MVNKLLEIKKNNILHELNRKIHINNWFTNNEQVFNLGNNFIQSYSLNESNESDDSNVFVPRFSLKKYSNPIFAKFPPNKEMKFDRDLMVLAMQYGMIILLQYRGAKDKFYMGRTRVIYPMCLGTSKNGKPLLRAYHIKGWSVSQNNNTEKVWRMFRTDRILSMSFVGSFFQLTPEGYNALDKGMVGGITKSVDIEEVRKNQKKLAEEGSIQAKKEVIVDKRLAVVESLDTNSELDLANPFSNKNIGDDKEKLKILRITFLKSTSSSKTIAVMGALGKDGNIVKISSSGKYLGEYRVLKSTMGSALGKPHMKNVKGFSKFDLHVFTKVRE